ncbi:hypothetical protein [Synechococcus sp. CCY9202]|uniref:hypothetical protein n=1 Tax=Synechococcus sp. CCY9202 TaxID=174698 RepID=UPI002B215E7F|nr:hypothetical protein [Synechococcus sp. CCY9202]MEA5423735.1 hypothetical protein [Synechococcus sp. CCY9202]
MTTSPSPPVPSSSRSNGASGSSLPQWRLWLSMLNWRRDPGYEQRMKQLRNETEQLKKENARLAAIESRLARFEREHLPGSNPLSSTGDSSPS